jgi:hypothetical protein
VSTHTANSCEAALSFNDMINLHRFPSREQHRKSRIFVFIAAPDQQFAANPFDKGSNPFQFAFIACCCAVLRGSGATDV